MSNKNFNNTLNQLISVPQGEPVEDEVICFIPVKRGLPACPPSEDLPLPPSNWYSVPLKDPS